MNKNGTRILFQDKITTRLFFLTKFIRHKSTAYSNAFDDFSLKKKKERNITNITSNQNVY